MNSGPLCLWQCFVEKPRKLYSHILFIMYRGILARLVQSCLNSANSVGGGSNVSGVSSASRVYINNSLKRCATSISDCVFRYMKQTDHKFSHFASCTVVAILNKNS